jgi:hypothetical protein
METCFVDLLPSNGSTCHTVSMDFAIFLNELCFLVSLPEEGVEDEVEYQEGQQETSLH